MGTGTSPLTVCLWLWKGWRPVYDFTHVNAMVGMVFDYLPIATRVVCFTDSPEGIQCETQEIWGDPFDLPKTHRSWPRPNSYRRLRLFSSWAAEQFPGRVLSLDLDAVIMDDISSLMTSDKFKINRGRASPYNGGMWQHRTGTRLDVWDDLTAEAEEISKKNRYHGSDQAWMSHKIKGAPTWGMEDGVYHFSQTNCRASASNMRVMFCAGSIKPWMKSFQQRWPAVAAQYRRYW